MSLIQQLRRIGQKMSTSQALWNSRDDQFTLIKKLYYKNGFDINGGGACPEQYEVFQDGKQVGYLRLRHGGFTVEYPDCGGELLLSEEPIGDGCFEPEERLMYLTKALRVIQNKIKQSNPETK